MSSTGRCLIILKRDMISSSRTWFLSLNSFLKMQNCFMILKISGGHPISFEVEKTESLLPNQMSSESGNLQSGETMALMISNQAMLPTKVELPSIPLRYPLNSGSLTIALANSKKVLPKAVLPDSKMLNNKCT
ncbi:hypothetical protein WICPIJ_003413 [Wickerhamomyces pijperi]|uniref:Uncharacterized protein n=1 Tax=Wickerhamomyces pijperi TaxID=599730 RepID=A0A9P8Q7E0_WICPI|nr:hypothetical protein WICPIJ_003413 [Wickerhamomyces pijperi]